jgi:hypothetical protein
MATPASSPFPTVNQAAFVTVSVLAVGTAASVFAAATAVATVATVAYSILAVTAGAVSIASISAWLDPTSTTIHAYFSNCSKHAGYAVAGAYQFVAQTLVQALIKGLADGVSTAIRRKISGDDVTVQVKQ